MWLAVVLNLTDEQWCQAKLVDYNVAYARTIAAVHYPTDNTAGLNLGQELLAIFLPEHLAERYGSDQNLVRQKIEQYRFDWNTFCRLTVPKMLNCILQPDCFHERPLSS